MKKSIFQNSGKLFPVFKNILDSFFSPILYLQLNYIERLKGRKHADVKFTFASHVRAWHSNLSEAFQTDDVI